MFAGDTLFSIGCGRVIEGTMEQMWQSMLKLRALPDDTMVHCGHEYTLANIRFAKTIEPDNKALAAREQEVTQLLAAGKPTAPSRLGDEKAANPFLRADAAGGREGGRHGRRIRPPRCSPKSAPARTSSDALSADDIIRLLGLEPHPEGGHFVETHRDARTDGRAHSTAIYFLLARGERSHWHRVDASRGLALLRRRRAAAGDRHEQPRPDRAGDARPRSRRR